MARDFLHWAARVSFTTNGPQSGKTSNEFHFQWNGAGTPASTDLSNLVGDVQAFYNSHTGGPQSLCAFMGPQIYRGAGACEIALYALDLNDPAHYYGSPAAVNFFTLGAAADSNPFPNEVAACISYRAEYLTDPEHDLTNRPRADDRGRWYIGPLCQGSSQVAAAPNGTTVAELATNLIAQGLRATTDLKLQANTHSFGLSVWSRKKQLFKPVAFKAVDTHFDTQRRREVEPSLLSWQAA